MLLLADIGVAQNAHPFRIGGHDAVLDAVMHHLDEVTGAVRPAVEVSEFGGAADFLAPGRAWNISDTRRQRFEDRIEVPHSAFRPADHHAVAALQPPHAAARPDVDVIDAFRGEFARAADVVDVIRVAAFDGDVPPFGVRHGADDV